MPGQSIRPGTLGLAGIGALLLWSGVSGKKWSVVARDLIAGKDPSTAPGNPIAGTPASALASATSVPGNATGSSIADDAMQYVGHSYSYGGAPGASGTNPWDCSSFVNWVLGHDLGMTLPGASKAGYNGASHGPNTISYLSWSGAETVGHSGASAQAGDLCVWQTHMGIATGRNQMISAHDKVERTTVTSIDKQIPEILFVRRIRLGG